MNRVEKSLIVSVIATGISVWPVIISTCVAGWLGFFVSFGLALVLVCAVTAAAYGAFGDEAAPEVQAAPVHTSQYERIGLDGEE